AGAGRVGVLATALAVCAFGLLVVAGLRPTATRLADAAGDRPGIGVESAALGVGLAAGVTGVGAVASAPWAGLGGRLGGASEPTSDAPIWAAACALVATLAVMLAAAPRRDRLPARLVVVTIAITAAPAALFAIVASTPAWFTALAGPY